MKFNMHVHIESVIERGSYINRFTLSESDVAYKNAILKGLVTGPRIFTPSKQSPARADTATRLPAPKKGFTTIRVRRWAWLMARTNAAKQ